MNEREYVLDPVEATDRRNPVFWTAKTLAVWGNRLLARVHVEFHEDVLRLRRQPNTVFFYVGLHKSLWETTGVLVPLWGEKLPLPYVGMGDNLAKGRKFQELAKKMGVFLIRRPTRRSEIHESARRLRADILGFIGRGFDVLVFPEGTRKSVPTRGRFGDFYPAAFEPLLEYERSKERICAENPGVTPRDLYIVPFNVDYSRVREAHEMVAEGSGAPQTLHVLDSLAMIRHIGDVHVEYGRPRRVADDLALDRKELAAECRRRCLALVKILPVNVASTAMLSLAADEAFSQANLEQAVRRTVDTLRPHAAQFRDFSPEDPPAAILRRSRKAQCRFDQRRPEDLPLHRLYAAYIQHYLDPAGPSGGEPAA